MTESALLDIPDLTTLEYIKADEQVQEFKKTWGVSPEGVCLPVFVSRGIPFENDFTEPVGVHYGGQAGLTYLGGIVREFARMGMNIYLSICPSLPFVRSDSLHIVDISGDSSSQACLGKAATRRLLVSLLKQAMRIVQEACKATKRTGSESVPRLAGIALDIVNLWPMGAKKERIELTCFCQECREFLRELSKRGANLVTAFEKFPNAWNLLLQDTGTGIRPISDIVWNTTPGALVDLSHLKGFDEILRNTNVDLNKEASTLIEYLHTRHRQVVHIVSDVFQQALQEGPDHNVKRILIGEADRYDWTAGVFLEKLDDPDICDELWLDPSELAFTTTRIANRAYMQRRSRYFLDAFFEFLANCQDQEKLTTTGMARLSQMELQGRLELRRRQAMGARLDSKLDLFCLPPRSSRGEEGRVGFVGPNLTEEISRKMVNGAQLIAGSEAVEDEKDVLEALMKALSVKSGKE
ncbi:MAG: hypothetical protein JW741_08770 [Sedimentisphaerales bacterium]|nr:hypothetical protein [Sedimentisphaerales bacterium]